MWSALGGRTEEEIHEHDPTYRRWALNLIRGGKLFAVIAESPRTGPVASGCLWLQPEQPRPVMMVLESPYILSMFTEPEYRGHGLASRIVETLIEIARKKGFSRVVLHAAKEDARRIYSRIGFEPSSEMRYFMDKSMRRDGWNATEPAAGRKKH
jgi:GNAT superfamily N-acetyltransferase